MILALGLILSVAAAVWYSNMAQREVRLKFENAASDARDAIQSRLLAYSDVLYGVKGLFEASHSVERDEFQHYIAGLDLPHRYPGIQVIHYSQHVTAAQLKAFETMVRNDTTVAPAGYPDFAVKPPSVRAEYVIVQYVEPMAGNEAALGLDLGGDAVRLASLERIRDSGQIMASGSIALALDPSRHPGFAVRLPLYRKGAPLATVAQRRDAFTGMVSASFVVIDLMRGILSEPFLQNLHVRIHDAGFQDATTASPPPSAGNLMFDSNRLLKTASSSSLPVGQPAGMTSELDLTVGGRRWNVYFSARQTFIPAFDRWLPWLVFCGGAVISFLLYGLIRSLAATRERAVALAANITDDLRHSEARLAAAQRMTQELIEVLPNPVFYKGTDGRYMGVNRAWEKYFGVSRDALVGKTVRELYPDNPELADFREKKDQELWDHPGTQTYESSAALPDGRRRDAIHYKATFTHADGSVAGLIGNVIDITQRKQIEAEHTRLAAIVDASTDAILSRDLEGTVITWNRGAEALFGYSAAEMIGRHINAIVPPELHSELRIGQEAGSGFRARTYESARLAKDGRLIDVAINAAPIRDTSGTSIAVALIFRDITERKRVEAERARLAAIIEHSNDAIYSRTLDGTILSWNAGAEKMFGRTAVEVIGKHIASTVSPTRPPELLENNARLLRGEVIAHQSDRITRDGRVIDVWSSISPIRDGAGKITGASVILQDITALKQAQAAAKESEARFRITFEQAEVGMVLADLDRRFMAVNRKFAEMTGYSRQELQGMSAHDIGYPEDAAATDAQRQDLLSGKIDSVTGERRFVRKDGSVFWAVRTLSLARNEQGDPLYFVGVSEDITERKEVAERYRATFDNAPVGILHTDSNTDRILHVNRKLCDLLGYTEVELLQLTTTDILHPDHEGAGRGKYRDKMLRGDIGSFS